MNGMYFQFARLVIRLLVAIYTELCLMRQGIPPGYTPAEVSPLIRESEAWLERYK